MPVYRYQQIVVDMDELPKLVPGPLVLGNSSPFVCVDITADAASKEDLDEAMLIEGWIPNATNPTDSTDAECGKRNRANNQKDETPNTGVAGVGVLGSLGTFDVTGLVTATSRIQAFYQVGGGAAPTGFLYTSQFSAAQKKFTIASSAGVADAGRSFYWQVWEPAP